MQPLTVIVPVKHFHEPFLFQAIGSIQAQTNPAWRLTIVVEQHDLETFQTLLGSQRCDPRIRVVVNRGHALAGAINTGMREADTDFVAVLMADDYWSSNAISVLQANRAAFPEIDFFHSSRQIVDAAGAVIGPVCPSRPKFTVNTFRRGGSPVKHLLCWRRAKGLEVGGLDERSQSVGPDDYDFPWTMAEHGARFAAVEESLYLYRDHRDGFRLTTHLTLPHHLRELDRILAKHGVDSAARVRRLAAARRGFLRQCLYRSRADRWWQRLRGVSARNGWREPYR
jgi:glycosyltransferase involved in cell wall biosynthesis